MWGGYEVRRYAPSGEVVARVSVSTAQPSCCAIGGANGTTLYITTAQEDMPASRLDNEPDAGRLFAVNVGITGRPLDPYRPSRIRQGRNPPSSRTHEIMLLLER